MAQTLNDNGLPELCCNAIGSQCSRLASYHMMLAEAVRLLDAARDDVAQESYMHAIMYKNEHNRRPSVEAYQKKLVDIDNFIAKHRTKLEEE